MSDRRPWRGGMIGAGAWSERQLKGWSRVANAEIVALCDRHPERRDPVAATFGIPHVFGAVETMLERADLDFIDICVRPYSHAALVKLAAARRLPVLCQKPFCRSLAEAAEMVAFCRRANMRLMINENFRWEPWYRKAKDLLDAGALGMPFLAKHNRRVRFTLPAFKSQQAYFAEMPHLLGYEMGPHYFDTFRFLFGEPSSLFARTHRVSPHMQGDDVLVVVLTYAAMTATIATSWASVPIPGWDTPGRKLAGWSAELLEIDGTDGTLVIRADTSLDLYKDRDHEHWEFDTPAMADNIRAALQHFVDCLASGAEFATSGEDTLKTMALVYAAYRSAEEGRVVTPGEALAEAAVG
ncbi:MAG: Gfo/Idh/MocA family oxidoreductase [Kiritimatiellae bacterium]|nr:Gfo/Idh/MocA family oxidoreductase [Kiritimatiellia bacterium]